MCVIMLGYMNGEQPGLELIHAHISFHAIVRHTLLHAYIHAHVLWYIDHL